MNLFDIPTLEQQLEELDYKVSEENFWNDNQRAQDILQKKKNMESKIGNYNNLLEDFQDLKLMIDLAIEESEESLIEEIEELYKDITNKIDEFKINILLNGEYDKNNAIISIHAGSGGLDAQDWAEMLVRMYTRWAERKRFKVKTLNYIPDKEGGIKSADFLIEGDNAYGYLKNEKGVHRIVRISPFDSSGRRHTSFASLDVMPELDDDAKIDIDVKDLRIDTFRSSGAGGQHVNKTDSAIRITHIPTNLVVQCQNERSQHQNKETAMKMLMAKLITLKEQEKKQMIDELQGDYGQISWGSQIRSYVFHPYTLVKDHRTNTEVGNVNSTMDGDIDIFINEKLKQDALEVK